VDVEPVSEVIRLTCILPFTAAGCRISLQGAVDETGDSSDAGTATVSWSCASKTLLQNSAIHTASLKHLLPKLSQLVSWCLSWLIPPTLSGVL